MKTISCDDLNMQLWPMGEVKKMENGVASEYRNVFDKCREKEK